MIKLPNTDRQSGKSMIVFMVVAVTAIVIGLIAQNLKQRSTAMPQFEKLIMLPKPRPLGEVNFTNHNGQPFGQEDLVGKWTILFFAFTNCPDICPSTLQALKETKRELLKTGAWPAFQVAFVSVDPERDTLERLSQYVPYFDPEFFGLRSGDMSYLTQFAKNVGILFLKGKVLEDGGYDVDHGASLILVNPKGEFAGVISAPHKQETLVSDLRKLGEFALKQPSISAVKKDLTALQTHTVDTDTNASKESSNLLVEDAWIRPAPPNASSMAGYLTITNNGHQDVKIVDSESPLFDMLMIHETVINDGVASMQHMDGLTIKAGETVQLAPMGAHIMLMRPENAVPKGTKVPVRLTLDTGEIIDLSIEVRDQPTR